MKIHDDEAEIFCKPQLASCKLKPQYMAQHNVLFARLKWQIKTKTE